MSKMNRKRLRITAAAAAVGGFAVAGSTLATAANAAPAAFVMGATPTVTATP